VERLMDVPGHVEQPAQRDRPILVSRSPQFQLGYALLRAEQNKFHNNAALTGLLEERLHPLEIRVIPLG
jgi:hypothetical protein